MQPAEPWSWLNLDVQSAANKHQEAFALPNMPLTMDIVFGDGSSQENRERRLEVGGLGKRERNRRRGEGFFPARTCCLGTLNLGGCLRPAGTRGCVFVVCVCGQRDKVATCKKKLVRRRSFSH